jgi:Holliday junction resolvasome RuvABC endonuclease subunit
MILALDASTKSTGYAIFENKNLITSGCITSASTDVYKRIHIMRDSLDMILIRYPEID